MAVDELALADEILNFLRDKLNTYDPLQRVEVQTTAFTATASQTLFELSPKLLSFVRSVTVAGVTQVYGTDYVIWYRDEVAGDEKKGKVEFTTAMTGGEAVSIVWGRATGGNFVFPDLPREDIGESVYPRVGFSVRSNSDVAGMGGGVDYPLKHNSIISIKLIHNDQVYLIQRTKNIKDLIAQYAKSFYNFRFISPTTLGEYDQHEDPANNVLSRTLDFAIPDQYETITYAT